MPSGSPKVILRPPSPQRAPTSLDDVAPTEHKIILDLQRPWNRCRNPKFPDRVLTMKKRNYKVYADVGIDEYNMHRKVSILDTGAGPNFIRRDELPEVTWAKIRQAALPDVCDANNRPLQTAGLITLPVKLGRYLVDVQFIVCNKLAASMILGADFCDRYVEAIRPRLRKVELEDGSTIPIIRKPCRRTSKMVPLPQSQRFGKLTKKKSDRIKVSKVHILGAHRQTFVEVTCERSGLIAIQPTSSLYENFGLICSNGIAQVEARVPFKILVANFFPS